EELDQVRLQRRQLRRPAGAGLDRGQARETAGERLGADRRRPLGAAALRRLRQQRLDQLVDRLVVAGGDLVADAGRGDQEEARQLRVGGEARLVGGAVAVLFVVEGLVEGAAGDLRRGGDVGSVPARPLAQGRGGEALCLGAADV